MVAEILVVDGITYRLSVPEDERQLEEMVKDQSKKIFGEDAEYFDLKKKITSESGISSIPDGYVIDLSRRVWYVVEVELHKHPLHEHITSQINKFYVGIKNLSAQRELVNVLYKEIVGNKIRKDTVERKIGSTEIKGFLYDLINNDPQIVVIIEEMGKKVEEACSGLKAEPAIIEFKTFAQEDAPNIRAHLFEPLRATSAAQTAPSSTGISKKSYSERNLVSFVEKEQTEEPQIESSKEGPQGLLQVLEVAELTLKGENLNESFKKVARRRGVYVSTVRDKCTRQLGINMERFRALIRDGNRFIAFLKERYPQHENLIDRKLAQFSISPS